MAKLELRLPTDCDEQVERQCRAVRYYFQLQKAVLLSVRPGVRQPRIAKIYDQPDKGYCVWYKIVKAAGKEYNPLWAVHHLFLGAIARNADVNPHSAARSDLSDVFRQVGARMADSAATSVQSSLRILTTGVVGLERDFKLTPESALSMLKSRSAVNPVLEMLWRDSRKYRVDTELLAEARIAYAISPSVYAHSSYPPSWLKMRKLEPLFSGVRDVSVVAAAAVDGLLSIKRATVE